MASSSRWLNSQNVTRCIEALKDDKYRKRAGNVIVNCFLEPLAERLRRKAPQRGKSHAEDAALHALYYALEHVPQTEEGAFPARENLFALLTVVGMNNLKNIVRAETCAKRGGDMVHGEADLARDDAKGDKSVFADVASNELPPDEVASSAEELQKILSKLSEEQYQIALWRVEGYTNKEIASKLGCVETTIERKMQRIRDLLQGSSP